MGMKPDWCNRFAFGIFRLGERPFLSRQGQAYYRIEPLAMVGRLAGVPHMGMKPDWCNRFTFGIFRLGERPFLSRQGQAWSRPCLDS